MSLRILHVLATMCRYHAGPATAAVRLAEASLPFGIHSEFFTTDLRGQPLPTGHFPLHCFHARAGRFAFSSALRQHLRDALASAQICHIHGIWTYPTLTAAWEAERLRVPYIVSPHGMLSVRSFQGWRGARNRILHRLGHRSALERAAAVHFTSEAELHGARKPRFLRVVVIHNCTLSRVADQRTVPQPHLLSLSRLHPGKNISGLIRALNLLPEPLRHQTRLTIAGCGPAAYTAELHRLAQKCDPTGHNITFAGEVTGAAKSALLEWASLLCLASYSEGQPMAVIESLAAGVPAVVSAASNMPQVAQYGAGAVVAHNTPEEFARAIAMLLLDPTRYQAASRAALQLVDDRFLATVVGQQWAQLYTSLAQARMPAAEQS